jgi:hypothetical protein
MECDHNMIICFFMSEFRRLLQHFAPPPSIPGPSSDLMQSTTSLQSFFESFNFRISGDVSPAIDDSLISDIYDFRTCQARIATCNQKKWTALWSFLSSENALWDVAGNRSLHWKRDNSLCFVYYPFKIKPNKSFDPHTQASTTRENGQLVTLPRPKVPLFDCD